MGNVVFMTFPHLLQQLLKGITLPLFVVWPWIAVCPPGGLLGLMQCMGRGVAAATLHCGG